MAHDADIWRLTGNLLFSPYSHGAGRGVCSEGNEFRVKSEFYSDLSMKREPV